MKRKLITSLSFALLLAFSAQAQRIASVDIERILNSLNEYKKAQDDLDRVAATWKQQVAEQYDEIKGMYNRYQAEQVLLSDEVRKQKEDEIMQKEREVREMQKSKFGPDGALFKKRQEMVKPIQEKVYVAIEDYANEKGYDFIFDKGGAAGLIFSNSRYDKTEDILKKLEGE